MTTEVVTQIPLGKLDLAKDNVRTEGYETDPSIQGLADSIARLGQLQPIRVQANTRAGRYLVIAGHRRVLAHRLLKLKTITAFVAEQVEDSVRTAEMLVENMQRVNLNPVEEYEGMLALKQTYGWTQAEIAERLGVSAALVKSRLSWAKLPDKSIEAIRDGKFTVDSANHLARASLDQIAKLTKTYPTVMSYDVDRLRRADKAQKVEGDAIRWCHEHDMYPLSRDRITQIIDHLDPNTPPVEGIAADAYESASIEAIRVARAAVENPRMVRHHIDTYNSRQLDAAKNADPGTVFEVGGTVPNSSWYQVEFVSSDVADADITDWTRALQAYSDESQRVRVANIDAVKVATAEFLAEPPATILMKCVMNQLARSSRSVQLGAALGIAGTKEAVVEYASKNKTQMIRAFAELCMMEYPRYEPECELEPDPSRPQRSDFDEDGKLLTDADKEARAVARAEAEAALAAEEAAEMEGDDD